MFSVLVITILLLLLLSYLTFSSKNNDCKEIDEDEINNNSNNYKNNNNNIINNNKINKLKNYQLTQFSEIARLKPMFTCEKSEENCTESELPKTAGRGSTPAFPQ